MILEKIMNKPSSRPNASAFYHCTTLVGIDYENGFIRMEDGACLPIVSLRDEYGAAVSLDDHEEAAELVAQWPGQSATFTIELAQLVGHIATIH